jgi:acetyl esterase/lipase
MLTDSPNNLLTHPLVSPVNLGSLGGLCPLMIVGGGGELLRDEIMFLAHKATAPTTYLPSSRTLAEYPDQVAAIKKYKPTRVHLQIYEGCCHVVPTLSWTSSAKYMYRACAK